MEATFDIKSKENIIIELLSDYIPNFIGSLLNSIADVLFAVHGVPKQKRSPIFKPLKKADKKQDRFITLPDGRKVKVVE